MATDAPALCLIVDPTLNGSEYQLPCIWNQGHAGKHWWDVHNFDPNDAKHRVMNAVHDDLWQPHLDLVSDIPVGRCGQCWRNIPLITTIIWTDFHWHVHEYANLYFGRVDVRSLVLETGSWTATVDSWLRTPFEGPAGASIEIWEIGNRIRYRLPGTDTYARAVTSFSDAHSFRHFLANLEAGWFPDGEPWSDALDDYVTMPVA